MKYMCAREGTSICKEPFKGCCCAQNPLHLGRLRITLVCVFASWKEGNLIWLAFDQKFNDIYCCKVLFSTDIAH
jgi:hypothetical protein